MKDTAPNTLVNLSPANTYSELLCQDWEDKADVDDAVLSRGGGGLEIPFHGYSFFDDGSMVMNPRDNIKFGRWKFDEKTKSLNIVLEDGSKKECKIMAIGVKKLLLKAGIQQNTEYVADGKKHSILTDDPFYPSNNKWRVPPAHAETDSAIKKRVISCVVFYSKFFKDNVDRGFSTISFYGLPTCFKWYAGGISIINKEKIDEKWIACFYNKLQATQAQQLLENIISKKYKWNKDQHQWVRQSADVLRQMADSLK